jgi:hypothetical protein
VSDSEGVGRASPLSACLIGSDCVKVRRCADCPQCSEAPDSVGDPSPTKTIVGCRGSTQDGSCSRARGYLKEG